MRIILILFMLSFSWHLFECVECDMEPKNNEGRLRKFLMCKYDKSNRPSLTDAPILVKIKMVLKGFDFEDAMEALSISSWLALSWYDDHLKWNPSEFNNINSIVESDKLIWQPDLSLYNSDVASTQNEFCNSANCVIESTGKVSCIPPCVHTAKCVSNYKNWPFDRQNCSMHLGTWVNSDNEIDLAVLKVIIPEKDLHSQNGEWRMISVTYKRNQGNYSAKLSYPSLSYSFTMERHSAQHAGLLIAPALIMIIINLTCMWLSPDSSQRMILISLNLLVHFLFLEQLSWYVPSNGDICASIVVFFRNSMMVTGMTLFITIIARGIAQCTVTVPEWLHTSTVYIGSNKIGQLVLSNNYLIEKHSFQSETTTDEAANLVESQTITKTTTWHTFAKLIDRSLFIFILVVYIIMFFTLIPMGYLTTPAHGDVTVTGY